MIDFSKITLLITVLLFIRPGLLNSNTFVSILSNYIQIQVLKGMGYHNTYKREIVTHLAQCNFLIFFQNLYYSDIKDHLTPSTSICIFPCFFMIYQSCQKKK